MSDYNNYICAGLFRQIFSGVWKHFMFSYHMLMLL